METLSILLSSGGAGETFFVGLLIGLTTWGWMALRGKAADSKAKFKNQKVQLIQENISQVGGLLKFINNLINYFKNSYNLQIREELENCIVMFCEEYEAAIAIAFAETDIIYIKFLNRGTGNGYNWTFDILTSQEEIINKIDSDIKSRLL